MSKYVPAVRFALRPAGGDGDVLAGARSGSGAAQSERNPYCSTVFEMQDPTFFPR
jgi:hypothetical protein